MNSLRNTAVIAAVAGALAALALNTLVSPARGVQNELVPPTSGIFTGVQYSQKLGDAFRSLASCNKGATAPANVNGSAVDGLCWIDDSGSPWVVKQYVNGGWAVTGYLDPSNSTFAGLVGGGLGTTAAAAITDLGSVAQANVTISGTTTISGFGASAPDGTVKFIRFAGALKLTNAAALAVPGGYDLTTAAGDRAVVTHLGSGNWEISQYTRANGVPVDASAVGKPDFTFADLPPLHLRGDGSAISRASYPAYFAKVTRAQNGTRVSGNATITGIADTTGFGAGMPVEGTGIGAGCTIAGFMANTSITLNSSACVTSSGTSTVTVFKTGYGSGGDATTVGLPNCQGRMIAGRDPSGTNISSAGSGIDAGAYNSFGGGQNGSIAQNQLPNVAPTITVDASTARWNTVAATGTSAQSGSSGSFGYVSSLFDGGASGGGVTNYASKPGLFAGSITAAATSINGGVTQQAFNKMPPTLIADCVVRVTP